MLTRYQTERLVRGVILLLASALFTLVGLVAGVTHIADKRWVLACIAAVLIAAAIASRLATKWVMENLDNRQARNRQDQNRQSTSGSGDDGFR